MAQSELVTLDELTVDALALPFFEDERPLRKTAGLVDWRLCGRLSRLMLRDCVTGKLGETTLVATEKKFPFLRLFLLGCGPSSQWDDRREWCILKQCLDTLEAAKIRAFAIALPGRSLELVDLADARARFLATLSERRLFTDVVIVEASEALRSLPPATRSQRVHEY
ncbi:MAG: peptidase M17 [Myxococcales bacterium]|nr:peptidase M17 [Myxococcales bacterium]MCB9708577.1 peptidase M17 [Myxococcales bacterium]